MSVLRWCCCCFLTGVFLRQFKKWQFRILLYLSMATLVYMSVLVCKWVFFKCLPRFKFGLAYVFELKLINWYPRTQTTRLLSSLLSPFFIVVAAAAADNVVRLHTQTHRHSPHLPHCIFVRYGNKQWIAFTSSCVTFYSVEICAVYRWNDVKSQRIRQNFVMPLHQAMAWNCLLQCIVRHFQLEYMRIVCISLSLSMLINDLVLSCLCLVLHD